MIELRPETAADFDELRALHRAAFAPSAADLVDALRCAGDHGRELCVVARCGGEIRGHVFFSRAQVDGADVLALAPMAVLPAAQRSGVSEGLVVDALRRAGETGFPLVVVLGHAEYYTRFGFEPAEALGIDAPFAVPAAARMAYPLSAYRGAVRGMVSYAEAFAAVS